MLEMMLAAVLVPMTNGEFRATVDLGNGASRELRIPAARLAGKGAKTATLDFDGVFWRLEAAGECDEDSVCAPMTVPPEYARTKPAPRSERRPLEGMAQYWRPHDWNANVGDVVATTFKDRLHLFYLYDRRNHASKGGTGGHLFAHLSTADLVHWIEEPDAIPLTEWWQTVGTGTPFVKDGKLCLAYGYHTERMKAAEGKPAGATWAESEDAIRFKPTGRFFHSTRNPTVYNRPDGSFGMILGYDGQGGMYKSDDFVKWTPVDTKIPANGDCPCYFEWNGHHYLLQGFTHYCRSETGLPGSWRSCDEEGKPLYDALRVPMVATWKDNRRFLIGWVSSPKGGWWGGWLVFRELKQRPDGSLYTQWIPELPNPGTIRVNGDGSRTAVYVDRDDPELVIEDTERPDGCTIKVRRQKQEPDKGASPAERPLTMFRFASVQTRTPEEWQGTLKAFKDNPACCDEVWFSSGESMPPLAWHREHVKVVERAAEDMRRLGYGVSLQIEATIGHGDNFPTAEERRVFDKHWTGWTCIDGTECKYCNCPRQPGFVRRMAEVAAVYAQVKPDVVWIDDDLRTRNHYPADHATVGCWCAKCLADFSAEEGVAWTREKFAEAWRKSSEVQKRWLDFNARSLGEVAVAITRAIRKVSPDTRMGLQMGYNEFRDHEVRVVVRAMAETSGGKVSVRIGGGGYYDDNPIAPLVKSQLMCEARKRLALEDVVENWCTELETYPRAYGSRSARSIALESFTAIGWGLDTVSLFVLDRRSESDEFYSRYLLRPLVGINKFLNRYRAVNRGTVPAGFLCPMKDSESERSRLLCGIPFLHGPGHCWGEISPEQETIGGLGAGWGELRMDLLPDWRKVPSARIQGIRDRLSADAPILLKSPFVGYVIPRVAKDGTLRSIGLVGTRLDPQRDIVIRVKTDAGRAVWHELEAEDIEVGMKRDGAAVIVTVPSIGAWNCGYLEFK